MLQEVCLESLPAILDHAWVQKNFNLTQSEPPRSIYDNIHGDSFVLERYYWKAGPHFTLMMVPKTIEILDCFRVPFVSKMGRDALFVDIPISTGEQSTSNRSIRLCTTHLECLGGSREYRFSQLALISTLLKETRSRNHDIIAGMVGGSMNVHYVAEHNAHRSNKVVLKDAWEDMPLTIPLPKRGQKDTSLGRARNNTWGYQSVGSRGGKRTDKFYYTGQLKTVPLSEPTEVTGTIGRLGIGLKTNVEAWQSERKSLMVKRGNRLENEYQYYTASQAANIATCRPVKLDMWVSDHFGIATGVRICD